jgi:hypothetical protein
LQVFTGAQFFGLFNDLLKPSRQTTDREVKGKVGFLFIVAAGGAFFVTADRILGHFVGEGFLSFFGATLAVVVPGLVFVHFFPQYAHEYTYSTTVLFAGIVAFAFLWLCVQWPFSLSNTLSNFVLWFFASCGVLFLGTLAILSLSLVYKALDKDDQITYLDSYGINDQELVEYYQAEEGLDAYMTHSLDGYDKAYDGLVADKVSEDFVPAGIIGAIVGGVLGLAYLILSGPSNFKL